MDSIAVSAVLAGTGSAVIACEDLVLRRQFKSRGILSWQPIALQYRVTSVGPVANLLRKLFSHAGDLILLSSRVVASVGIVLSAVIGLPLWPWSLALFVLLALLTLRIPYGLDGAHQMYVIIFGSMSFGGLDQTALVEACVVIFIAAEAMLAYLVSGVAKISSPQWRNGDALPQILGTDIYGHQVLSELLGHHSAVARALSWAVIGFEMTFPVLVLLSPATAVGAVVAGTLFHSGTAFAMGLNGFFFAFVGTYPAVLDLAGAWPIGP